MEGHALEDFRVAPEEHLEQLNIGDASRWVHAVVWCRYLPRVVESIKPSISTLSHLGPPAGITNVELLKVLLLRRPQVLKGKALPPVDGGKL